MRSRPTNAKTMAATARPNSPHPGLTPEEQAELDAIRGMQNVESFADFVGRVSHRFAAVPPHLKPLYDLVQRSRYEQVFATVSEPPRHGKSTTFALAFAYRVLYDPACQNFYTTYADDRSRNVGRATQRIVESMGIPLDRSARGADDWKTSFGGGLKSTSIGGQITGEGANGGLVVADDLLKGFKSARSRQARDDAYNYLTTDVMSRIEGGASLIVMNTRWHEDDPIGRIKKNPLGLGEIAGTKPWTHINMPAIHDGAFNPIDEREHPELATPLWLDVDSGSPGSVEAAMRWYALCRARGEWNWWSLYQGTPRSSGQKVFGDCTRYTLPGSKPSRADAQPFDWTGKRGCVILDPAATKKTKSDYNALGVVAMEGHGEEARAYVVEAVKKHMKVPEAARLAYAWHVRYGLPLVIEGVGGFASVQQIIEEMCPGIEIDTPPMLGDKFTRAQPAADAWNAGRYLVPTPVDMQGHRLEHVQSEESAGMTWMDDVIEIAQGFTGNDGDEDDLVDMLAHGFNYLNGNDRARRSAAW